MAQINIPNSRFHCEAEIILYKKKLNKITDVNSQAN